MRPQSLDLHQQLAAQRDEPLAARLRVLGAQRDDGVRLVDVGPRERAGLAVAHASLEQEAPEGGLRDAHALLAHVGVFLLGRGEERLDLGVVQRAALALLVARAVGQLVEVGPNLSGFWRPRWP
jgi:hypothetical protein